MRYLILLITNPVSTTQIVFVVFLLFLNDKKEMNKVMLILYITCYFLKTTLKTKVKLSSRCKSHDIKPHTYHKPRGSARNKPTKPY